MEASSLADTTEKHIDYVFNTNVRVLLFVVQKAVPLMNKGSSVILIGSVAGSVVISKHGTYSASKAAVRAYTKTWVSELTPLGIRVNTISPGLIDTPMVNHLSEEVEKAMMERIPMHRFGKTEEVAATALFMASDDSSYLSGVELFVDGGLVQV